MTRGDSEKEKDRERERERERERSYKRRSRDSYICKFLCTYDHVRTVCTIGSEKRRMKQRVND